MIKFSAACDSLQIREGPQAHRFLTHLYLLAFLKLQEIDQDSHTHDDTAAHENRLCRLLNVLPIKGWQWINIHHQQTNLITVQKWTRE
jgi:hypothetical protein